MHASWWSFCTTHPSLNDQFLEWQVTNDKNLNLLNKNDLPQNILTLLPRFILNLSYGSGPAACNDCDERKDLEETQTEDETFSKSLAEPLGWMPFSEKRLHFILKLSFHNIKSNLNLILINVINTKTIN